MSFIPTNGFNGFNNNSIPIQPMNPYQDRIDRYVNLSQQQSQNNNNQQLQSNTNMNFVVVENIQKAKEQIVPYGYTMWMRDSSEPYQYVKSVDQVGTPSFKVLKVEDVTDLLNNQKNLENENNKYVSIDEYNKLNNIVNQLVESVNYYGNVINEIKSTNCNKIVDNEVKEQKRTTQRTSKKVGDIDA